MRTDLVLRLLLSKASAVEEGLGWRGRRTDCVALILIDITLTNPFLVCLPAYSSFATTVLKKHMSFGEEDYGELYKYGEITLDICVCITL